MRQSQLFTKTRREAPKDEVSKNAILLCRAGYVHKEQAGVYSLLPLGLLALNKINAIIRHEMASLDALELSMASLQDPKPWQASGRWSDEAVDVWFKTDLKTGSTIGLGLTFEEPLTALVSEHLRSYRDLPLALYQIQTKFRNETRAKSGLLRGREFLMKDLYSFHRSKEDLDDFYERVRLAYDRIFAAVGLADKTFFTFASGGSFSRFSHEFQVVSEAGEDTIYVSAERRLAVNLEVASDETLKELGLSKEELVPRQAIEVGNIFKLGTRFSEPLGLRFTDEKGGSQPVVMGSYGLGATRLLGTLAEVLSDDQGLVWPRAVAPFLIHLVWLPGKSEAGKLVADNLYNEWRAQGLEVLYDDRPLPAGEKFADSDLLGLPYRVVVSDRLVEKGEVEIRVRQTGETTLVKAEDLVKKINNG
jgi:prolyl-tRNA synthetase